MALIGFVGMGNMGYAMMKGALKKFSADDIIFSCPEKDRCKEIYEETGVRYADSNAECVNNAKYIILAVKPVVYPLVYKNIENVLRSEHVVISLAPGIDIDTILDNIGRDKRVVRAMPNTPALIGAGMTGIAYDEKLFNFEEKEFFNKFFNSFGKFAVVPESLMSAVVCASGSSPAYVYMFIEALADSVVACGMPRDKAYEFVAQTVMGSAQMVLQTKEHPGVLKDRVCSPGGTTIQGVAALEENGFRNSLFAATRECYKKCENK